MGSARGKGRRLSPRSAKLSGNSEKARDYYGKLLAICEHADGDRPELQEARTLQAER
jgi:hypothetical protein